MSTFTSFSRDQLFLLRREDINPTWTVRKSIFRNRLWLPCEARGCLAASLDKASSASLSSVSPAPELNTSCEGTPDVTSPDSNQRCQQQQQRREEVDTLLSFGLLNQSVGNKYTAICGEIIDRSIQVCLLTETWHTTATDTAMRRCIPPGYALYDVPRPSDGSSQNHGGVAAIVSSVYNYRAFTPPYAPATFESMAFTLTGSPVVIYTAVLLIYRPGSARGTNSLFVELTAYLEAISMFKCPCIIAGDIHIEDEDGGNARKLMDLLHSFDC